jgi:hypothetical protein
MRQLKVRIRDEISRIFHRIDHVLVPSVPRERFSLFVESIKPIDNEIPLIRVGPSSDGSYLLPDDLNGIGVNISPGVGETFQFEYDLLTEYRIPSIMCDASVEIPSNLPCGLTFIQEFIVPCSNSKQGISMSELVSLATTMFGKDVDFMLQMDIEGAEYEILKQTNPQNLLRFRILAIEFHDIELWCQNVFFSTTLLPIFDILLKYFDVVHSRSNNSSHTFSYKGYFMPSALELTFHRKDRSVSKNGYRVLPSILDFIDYTYTSQKTPFELNNSL